jgi:Methionine biosynthesis protein MetW
MNNFFKENYKSVHQEWVSPEDVKDSSILDLGSQTSLFGEYCTTHGAKDYVGVEIDKLWIDRSRESAPHLTYIHMDLEDYLDQCIRENKFFDITVISRTIEGIHNQVEVLQKLSHITNSIVIEGGLPVNFAAYELLKLVKSFELSSEQKEMLDKAEHYIQYEQPFVEYLDDDQKFIWAIPSIGFYDSVLSRLGFSLSLDTYERVKAKFPTEYGYFTKVDPTFGTAKTHIGKAILKFNKTSNEQKPLTWKEWYDAGGV